MAEETKVNIPDIGGATDVDVIEILVKPGDEIEVDTPLITLESDKASMDIPSPISGKVLKMHTKVGDKVSQGDLILTVAAASSEKSSSEHPDTKSTQQSESDSKSAFKSDSESDSKPRSEAGSIGNSMKSVSIPDIGGATDVDVIEVLVKSGDSVKKEQSLITLEGDKATMEIPSPYEGEIKKIAVKVGDKVSQGSLILEMMVNESSREASSKSNEPPKSESTPEITKTPSNKREPDQPEAASFASVTTAFAGPAVRRMARELGVNLDEVRGSGRKNRILKEDVEQYIKKRLSEKPSGSSLVMPTLPAIDFSQFGKTEVRPLNKIKRLTGQNVHRSWITIPHVTQFDEADITDLEAFRKTESEKASEAGYKLTILAFVMKVVAHALTTFPQFNASLDSSMENLIYKNYCNIGIAVETPNGLVVPVIKQVDILSVSAIAKEMAVLSKKAREKGLMPADMSGGCFTISSLGGIGGTAFTPIVNSPEVAILGLSRSTIKPVWRHSEFKPRLMLPLSLSYDHRVIDGAEAARFTRYLAEALEDLRRIML